MYALVVEQASLGEVPQRVVDYVSDGEPVVHGPWAPAACSAHLLRWFDQGFIELYEVGEGEGEDRALASTLSRERLLAWDRWGDGDELWARTCLVMTDAGVQGLERAAQLPS